MRWRWRGRRSRNTRSSQTVCAGGSRSSPCRESRSTTRAGRQRLRCAGFARTIAHARRPLRSIAGAAAEAGRKTPPHHGAPLSARCRMRVLILGARAPVCLEWARAFHAAGARVTVADSVAWPLTRASAAVERYVRLPEPRYATNEWLDAIAAEIERGGIDLLLPTCEEVFYLSHGMARLPASCRIFTSDFALLRSLHHKGHFAAPDRGLAGGRAGDAGARNRRDVEDLYDEAAGVGVQAGVFTVRRLNADQTHGRPFAKVRPTALQPWVAQRFVRGREHCSFSVFVDGRVTIAASYHPSLSRRPRFRHSVRADVSAAADRILGAIRRQYRLYGSSRLRFHRGRIRTSARARVQSACDQRHPSPEPSSARSGSALTARATHHACADARPENAGPCDALLCGSARADA